MMYNFKNLELDYKPVVPVELQTGEGLLQQFLRSANLNLCDISSCLLTYIGCLMYKYLYAVVCPSFKSNEELTLQILRSSFLNDCIFTRSLIESHILVLDPDKFESGYEPTVNIKPLFDLEFSCSEIITEESEKVLGRVDKFPFWRLESVVYNFLLQSVEETDVRAIYRCNYLRLKELQALTTDLFINTNASEKIIEILQSEYSKNLPGSKRLKDYFSFFMMSRDANCSPYGFNSDVVPTPITEIALDELHQLKVLPIVEEFMSTLKFPEIDCSSASQKFSVACVMYSALNAIYYFDDDISDNAGELWNPYARIKLWEVLIPQSTIDSVVFNEIFFPNRDCTGFAHIANFNPVHKPKQLDTTYIEDGDEVPLSYKVLTRSVNFLLARIALGYTDIFNYRLYFHKLGKGKKA